MTTTTDSGGTQLLRPKPDDTPTPAQKPAAAPRRQRPMWPVVVLIVLIIGALTVLGLWTLSQARTVDEVVDAPRIPSTHDSGITMQLREQGHAATSADPLDPWAQARLRDRERATAQEDPWLQARLREREPAAAQQDPWLQSLLREREQEQR